jgi:hypothetical protein
MNRQVVGFIGAAALGLGVFMPLISMPIVGTVNYFNNGSGDGIFILALALIAAVLVGIKRYGWLWAVALASLGLIGYAYMNISARITLMKVQLELDKNPFAGLVNVQMQWGWGVLLLGVILLCVAAGMREPETAALSEYNRSSTA